MSDSLNSRLNNITEKFSSSKYPYLPKKNLLIEVTNSCNCNCIFCANNKMTRRRNFIDEKIVYRLLKEAYDLGVREVGFYTTGEPLLNPKLEEYITYAKKLGYIYTYITTNGILLNDKRIKSLVNSCVDSIKISINAINKEDYKFIHGVDKFEVVMNNLKNLYNYRKENNSKYKIFVSYVATKYTDIDINEIKNFFKDYCDEVGIINVRNQNGMMPEICNFSCENGKNKIKSERNIPCHYVFNTINVTCEGYLSACCTDFQNYLVYADLNKVSLKEAWHNEIITELREKHLHNKIDNTLCYNCIHSNKEMPNPLLKDLASKFNGICEDDKILDRIKKYRKED